MLKIELCLSILNLIKNLLVDRQTVRGDMNQHHCTFVLIELYKNPSRCQALFRTLLGRDLDTCIDLAGAERGALNEEWERPSVPASNRCGSDFPANRSRPACPETAHSVPESDQSVISSGHSVLADQRDGRRFPCPTNTSLVCRTFAKGA